MTAGTIGSETGLRLHRTVRALLLTFVALLACFMLSACGGGSSSSDEAAGEVADEAGQASSAQRDAAVAFIQAWYDDWTFADGHEVINDDSRLTRCSPLIAEDSELFDEFAKSCTGYDGKYARGFAACVVSTPTAESLEGDKYRVTVSYLGTQNSVNQAMYDNLIQNPNEDIWDVAVGEDNKIVALERTGTPKASNDARYAAYLKKVEEYQSKYGSHKMMTFLYGQEWSVGLAMVQLVDFNGDGNEELLLAYRDAGDADTSLSGYMREAYHVEVWAYDNDSMQRLYSGMPSAGDGGFMPVVLCKSPEAAEAKVVICESEDNGIYGEGHEGVDSYYGYGDGTFGLLLEMRMTHKEGEDSVQIGGGKDPSAASHFSGEIKAYEQTFYYLDGLMRPSSDSQYVDCERVFRITDETIVKLGGADGAEEAEDDGSDEGAGAASQYDSILSAYRSGLDSDTQPPYETVNPEAWIAREYNKGRYAYALYDINGDGSDELLIGLEEDAPVSEEGPEVFYRLYDLFTLDNGKVVRVLDDEKMGSLGYRAYCIPCENGIISIGGSSGATLRSREYWRLGEKANDMSLLEKVTIDGDTYTFEDSDGVTDILTGAEGQLKYEDEVLARYMPLTEFAWKSL